MLGGIYAFGLYFECGLSEVNEGGLESVNVALASLGLSVLKSCSVSGGIDLLTTT